MPVVLTPVAAAIEAACIARKAGLTAP
jgi:hypothetical protein